MMEKEGMKVTSLVVPGGYLLARVVTCPGINREMMTLRWVRGWEKEKTQVGTLLKPRQFMECLKQP
jgi:hypothetical protein